MKFGKKLRETVRRSHPRWRDKFIDYKRLKKLLKADARGGASSGERDGAADAPQLEAGALQERLRAAAAARGPRAPFGEAAARPSDTASLRESAPAAADPTDSDTSGVVSTIESDTDSELSDAPPHELLELANQSPIPRRTDGSGFFDLLHDELDKVNEFFIDRMEECVIRYEMIMGAADAILREGGVRRRGATQELQNLRRLLKVLHVEMLSLQNFSTVNYLGFRKALKKYDKKRGTHLRRTYLAGVLHTPFFMQSETLRTLIRGAEAKIQEIDRCTGGAAALPYSAERGGDVERPTPEDAMLDAQFTAAELSHD
ncbi:hypothetical protein CDCA_CDCA11G3261 [Cyanidium caldarium]|uniref:SPX domain-containing protein n=1 Tax=Cyanidium caldarium TaxID=2771 RepID=A0AAV9IYS2_CYACA|nr:hypothetical protein CDCA_CDCA11G3261 [Cyanidium caldarium]